LAKKASSSHPEVSRALFWSFCWLCCRLVVGVVQTPHPHPHPPFATASPRGWGGGGGGGWGGKKRHAPRGGGGVGGGGGFGGGGVGNLFKICAVQPEPDAGRSSPPRCQRNIQGALRAGYPGRRGLAHIGFRNQAICRRAITCALHADPTNHPMVSAALGHRAD